MDGDTGRRDGYSALPVCRYLDRRVGQTAVQPAHDGNRANPGARWPANRPCLTYSPARRVQALPPCAVNCGEYPGRKATTRHTSPHSHATYPAKASGLGQSATKPQSNTRRSSRIFFTASSRDSTRRSRRGRSFGTCTGFRPRPGPGPEASARRTYLGHPDPLRRE